MAEPLHTYLNDHLGGAQIALRLLHAMRDQNDDQRYRTFASNLAPEIEADDKTLRQIVKAVGSEPSAIKQAGGWLLEKAARLKLGHTEGIDMEMFESLEVLALGIAGKMSLWKSLQAASLRDPRLRPFPFDNLLARAEQQFEQVELERLRLAEFVLAPTR